MLFAYLSDSDSVNVTSVYEMYPIGWFSIKQRLADHRFDAKIVNVASLMLMYPDLDVRRLPGRLEAPTARSWSAPSAMTASMRSRSGLNRPTFQQVAESSPAHG